MTCETLSEVLIFLRVSLNGAILETLRDSKRPGAVSSPWPDGEDRLDMGELWDRLQARLSHRREKRPTYLLYHCGLAHAQTVRHCPQEWGKVQEVIRLRRTIFMQLMKGLICEEQTFV